MAEALSNHTGNELQLMLENKKPLSMFYDNADLEPDEGIIPEGEFDKFVELGMFSKAERVFQLAFDSRIGRHHRVRYVLYCLKGHEWRMEALFLALKTRMMVSKYDEGIDRIVSSLLGYTDEETDKYIAAMASNGEQSDA